MGFLDNNLKTCMDALFLREDLFAGLKGMSLGKGFMLILFVGFIAGGACFVGQTIKYANEPTFAQVEGIWKEPMRQQQHNAPWFSYMPREARVEWDKGYDMTWMIVRYIVSAFNPPPAQAFAGIFLGVLWKLCVWLVAGLVLFLSSKILGGTGSLGETLVAVSLGVTPHLLEVANILPYVATAGIFIWSCVIIGKGMMNVHGLNRGKTLLVFLLLPLILAVLLLMAALLG